MSAGGRSLRESVACRPLVIAGLRRSGTTVLWETLRLHPSLIGFDEPFHPRLWQGLRESTKGTWAELTALWNDTPAEFMPGAIPIEPFNELDRAVDAAQAAYFAALLAQNNSRVVVDIVRAWNKLPELISVTPQPYVVQLVRSPVPWVLSHLLPSGKGSWRKPIGDALRRVTAMRRKGHFDNWQYETIINHALATRHPLWGKVAIAPDRLAASPAYVKLLAFWWSANRTMAEDLADAAPGRHQILLVEDFMEYPGAAVEKILACIDLSTTAIDTSTVHPARWNRLHNNPAFAAAFDALGIPHKLLPGADPTSKTMASLLSCDDMVT